MQIVGIIEEQLILKAKILNFNHCKESRIWTLIAFSAVKTVNEFCATDIIVSISLIALLASP